MNFGRQIANLGARKNLPGFGATARTRALITQKSQQEWGRAEFRDETKELSRELQKLLSWIGSSADLTRRVLLLRAMPVAAGILVLLAIPATALALAR